MSPSKTLYVRDEDVSVWEQAEQAAKARRQSVSSVVTAALRSYLQTLEGSDASTSVKHVELYPQKLRVITREQAEDPHFDGGSAEYTFTGQDSSPILQWIGGQGWQLYFLNRRGEIDDHLVSSPDAPTEWAIGLAREFLEGQRSRPGQVTVDMRDDNGREWSEAFAGRWLVEPGDDNRGTEDAGACYGIALTAKGRIAVYAYHVNDRWAPALQVYDTLDEAEADITGLPKELVAAASSEMGQQRIVWRDI